jgi:molybdopterin-containing oxidoreductase family membrane subunit
MSSESVIREPLITGGKTVHDVTEDISRRVEEKPTKLWMLAMTISLGLLAVGAYTVFLLLWHGIGMWGLNKTVGWAWDITNFVWWVGIGHAGTLISAILLLFRQRWRMSINRAAEAMTIFAVICALQFPILHTGRPWLAIIGCFLYPIRLDHFGLILTLHSCGMYLLFPLTFWCH